MPILIDKATLLSTTTTSGAFRYGGIYEVHDPVYGDIKAMYCKFTEAVAVIGSPMYAVPASFNVAGGFLVSDDENGDGVIGQEACVGVCLSSAATTAAAEGFVQLSGLNLVALTTDEDVTAGQVLIPSTTDGTWDSVDAIQAVDEGGASTYSVYNRVGMGTALFDDATATLAAGKAWISSPFIG